MHEELISSHRQYFKLDYRIEVLKNLDKLMQLAGKAVYHPYHIEGGEAAGTFYARKDVKQLESDFREA